MKHKSELSIEYKENLSFQIQSFIKKKKDECKQPYNQDIFSDEIDEVLGISNKNPNGQKVSKWINKKSFPDIPSLVAIAIVMDTTVDDLLLGNSKTPSKTADLNASEREILRLLIEEKIKSDKVGLPVSLYMPFSYSGEKITADNLYTKTEAATLYKQRTEVGFKEDRLKDYINLLTTNNLSATQIKKFNHGYHFPKFCNVRVLETDITVENDLPILYDDTDEYYERIRKVRIEQGDENIYNIYYFCETIMDEEEKYESWLHKGIDKDSYYKTLNKQQEVYQKSFESLIEKGFIKPSSDSVYGTDLSRWESKEFVRFSSIDSEEEHGKYEMQLYKFNFEICMSETAIKIFLKEEIDRN